MGIPRGLGLGQHCLAIAAVVGVGLWIVVPRAIGQVQNALGGSPQARIHQEATRSYRV